MWEYFPHNASSLRGIKSHVKLRVAGILELPARSAEMALRPENRSSGLLAQVRPAGAIGPREGPGEAAGTSFTQKLGPRRGLSGVGA